MFARSLFGMAVCLSCILLGTLELHAQEIPEVVREIRTLYPHKFGVPNPTGLVHATATNQFYLMSTPENSGPGGSKGNRVISITPYEDFVAMVEMEKVTYEAVNLAFDNRGQKLFVYDDAAEELVQIELSPTGALDPSKAIRTNLKKAGLKKAAGIAIDPTGQQLYAIDKNAKHLLRLDANPTTGYADPQITWIELGDLRKDNIQGIAVHPIDGHLYVLSVTTQRLYKLTTSGQIVTAYDLTSLALNAPFGFVFAPSSDRTDPADTTHLFIADEGDPKKNKPGKIVEVALGAAAGLVSAAATTSLSLFLVQEIDLSTNTPPLPDPAGITYLPATKQLLLSDSEVDEMSIYAGANFLGLSLTNTMGFIGSSLPWSEEPTGVSYNPNTGEYYVSDDDDKEIDTVNPGPDGQLGTVDDMLVKEIDATTFNSFDAEDVTYDAVNNVLYVVDGINSEVYQINAGVNGRFDGLPVSGGDDVVTNFDVLGLGIQDPEGIYYDSVSDHLFIVAKSDEEIYELTTGGFLVRILNCSVIDTEKMASIVMAPGSKNPAVMNFYITDRGIDNDLNPAENDGKLYEFTLTRDFGDIVISTRNNGTIGGVQYRDEDLLGYDTETDSWTLIFDGSDVGITTDVTAFDLQDDGSILLSFEVPTTVTGLGLVDDSDIVRFIPTSLGTTTDGAFAWYLDGSDVGLVTDSDDIDAILRADSGAVILSMLGSPTPPGITGAQDEDLLLFTPLQVGEVTTGTWSFYFDGSDVGLWESSEEDIQGGYIYTPTGEIYLSTKGNFDITGIINGTGADIFICMPTALGSRTRCNFSFFWHGSDHGMGTETIDGFEVIVDPIIAAMSLWHSPTFAEDDQQEPIEADSPEQADPDEGPIEEEPIEETYLIYLPIIQ